MKHHSQSAPIATTFHPQPAALVDFHEKSFEPPNVKVSLGKLEAWVKDQVKHGDYNDCSEVVRDAVRKLKQTINEPSHLQGAMDRAEKSGFKSFDASDWEALRNLAGTLYLPTRKGVRLYRVLHGSMDLESNL